MSDSKETEDIGKEVPLGNPESDQQELKIIAETESEDKNSADQKILVETKTEDKDIVDQVVKEAPVNVKPSESRDNSSLPPESGNVSSPPPNHAQDNDANTEAVEAPLDPKVEARDDEVPVNTAHGKEPVAEPVSGLNNQAEENEVAGDEEDKKKNENGNVTPASKNSYLLDEDQSYEGNESGSEEDQSNFMKELESFFRERSMEFKPPKFYGEALNCLKLWRAVTRLGGYEKVTSCKLWRQVGESFRPPKTCTTVSWTFRGFYEKALLDYEKHKISGGELNMVVSSQPEPAIVDTQASGSGRARRDAAARAMQGWHSQRLLGNGEVGDPIIKDKSSPSAQKREKQVKTMGLLKRKKAPYADDVVKPVRTKTSKSQLDSMVVDIGPPADWVKINVQRTKDCFEVYALVPGLLREEVRVQSDAAGRLVISGEPEQLDNPWGLTPFKKVVSLPSRIDPHQTSAVVTLHGQLFVRVPFEHSD